ncbi:MAG: UDP-N-acetylmuramoyl-L-alanine--D-glutamate ligase [Actinomycetota bacterium]
MSGAWQGTHALVAGLGRSGVAAARALAGRGATVRAVDAAASPAVVEAAAALAAVGVETAVGASFDDPRLLGGVDLVVPSPGIAPANPLLAEAARRGLAVASEPELAWRLAGGRTRLAVVTGTNGKTTTTELLAALLDAPVGGNIGTPLCDLLATASPPPLVVAELSSFQLHYVSRLAAEVVVLVNLAPDHLDWHGDERAYVAAKARAWECAAPGATVVVGDDDGAREALRRHPFGGRRIDVVGGEPAPGQIGVVDGVLALAEEEGALRRIVAVDELGARGRHNVGNAAAAAAAAVAAGAGPETLAEPLRRYHPGPHRLEPVASRGGVTWVNDSKATNPHAAAAALEAYRGDEPRVVWIAGGLAKGLDPSALAPALRAHVRAAVTIGTSGPELAALARAEGIETTEAGSLERAVAVAAATARPGDVVLLAPACASMDQFPDYAARGEAFRRAVTALDEEVRR